MWVLPEVRPGLRHSRVAAQLTDLMRKKTEWRWGDAERAAFDEFKKRLLQHPVLVVPDFAKAMVLHTDASDVVVGATLSQMGEDGNLHLVACRYRKLSQAEIIIILKIINYLLLRNFNLFIIKKLLIIY